MFEQLTITSGLSRRARVVLAATAFAATLGMASGAQAAQTHTKYFSIDVAPQTTSSPALFVTATSTGQIQLKRYASGEWRQQWTPVYPEWPTSPTVTGSSPVFEAIGDFFETFADCVVERGCPFSAPGPLRGSPRKFVNRMYAMCMTFTPTGSVTTKVSITKCKADGTAMQGQVFVWKFTDKQTAKRQIPREYTPIFGHRGDQGRCLDIAGGSAVDGTNAAALPCDYAPANAWRQSFRFLETADITCKQYYPGTLCGLGAPVQ